MTTTLWKTKLAARIHDPAEKALVLLRDPAGHEGGTSRVLKRDLGLESGTEDLPADPDALGDILFDRLAADIHRAVKRADWWSAAADRPQWPLREIDITTRDGKEKTLAVADYARVNWVKRPILKHPLTGEALDLKGLQETDIRDIKQRSREHFQGLICRDGAGNTDWQRTLLAFWRFGPTLKETADNHTLGHLWPLLPADTRVPDHSIWDHLDLASAFAGAFAGDSQGEAALLAMSIGPVQEFIASARSTSDLWAGSHLLSRLAWETMRVICEELGPDAILFPRLRGIPQVDLWLRDTMNLPKEWFADEAWAKRETDANPLFSGALPNRFVAVVPAERAEALAQAASDRVRRWLDDMGRQAVDALLDSLQINASDSRAHRQMREQLEGFPEVHWAAVPFSLIRANDRKRDTDLDVTKLSEAMAPFFDGEDAPGFLGSPVWHALSRAMEADGIRFFSPNPGVLYPAVHDLADRVLAAAKAVRPFQQTRQEGWRCTLSGEAERLALDDEDLQEYPGRTGDSLWNRVAGQKKSWAKRGEHLAGLPALKRLWPSLFAAEVAQALGMDRGQVPRFVVSTHTMALAGQLERWMSEGGRSPDTSLMQRLEAAPAVPLPRRLARQAVGKGDFNIARRLPGLLESAAEADQDQAMEEARQAVSRLLGQKPEAYYALLMMDGDHMGRILSGDPAHAVTYRESFHPDVQAGFDRLAGKHPHIRRYGEQKRALSPGRHMAISSALNDFTLHVVPEVVEEEHPGRLLYAGGDDVLAMLPVGHLLPAMRRLRDAYSGRGETSNWQSARQSRNLVLSNGFAMLRGRLMRMMGEGATASAGGVVAHHQAPLTAVRRALEAAEKRAKNEGGRDAFSLTIVKRSGGELSFTAKWDSVPLLERLIAFLADPRVSRRAVYHSLQWLATLPSHPPEDMMAGLLCYQFERQCAHKSAAQHHDVPGLSRAIAGFALDGEAPVRKLANLLAIAEFLARESRSGASSFRSAEHGEIAHA
ncbi:type III-B CRISPR-associated protein Cas10/Cmr2 [Ectothiorhodospira shaposhnikovii]|uniref:type III-B CRISPR-associated protein Cas10/Cmr2 n=1 Tax=Ectothiorhodospira shaposhnikovii TaxID=1054 RepID=UPI00399FDD71